MASQHGSELPAPRLCHVVKWADFEGYGFNLRSDKVRGGQCIGTVDEGSPAEAAGLKDGDKIIEVNGVSVLNENHRQVVQRIKELVNETKLLVVDEETEEYYDARDIAIHGKLSSVRYMKTPPRRTSSVTSQSSSEDEEDVVAVVEPPKPAERKEVPAAAAKVAATTMNGVNATTTTSNNNTKDQDKTVTSPSSHPNRPTGGAAISAPGSNNGPPPLRLCRIIKWDQKQSFGFHLYGDNAKREHYIGKIDPGSPADSAGLRVKDRIVQVNGSDVSNKSHKEIVQTIKADPSETTLLVVDPAANAYYQRNSIVIRSSLPNVIRLQSSAPLSLPASAPSPAPRQVALTLSSHSGEDESRDDISDDDDVRVRPSRGPQQQQQPPPRSVQSAPTTFDTPPAYNQTVRPLSAVSVTTLAAARATGLDLSMTAAELRARLANRKKVDPRRQRIDLLQKYKMIQTM